LGDEPKEVEVQFSVGGEGDTSGNHEDNDGELFARLLYAECPRYQENGDGGEGLGVEESESAVSGYQDGRTLSI